MARSDPPMVGSFVAEFARRLQGKSPALALPLTWIEQRLSDDGLTIEHLVQSENQQQAADQVSISNSISSLRFLGAADWRDFVEARSEVERTLREDPAGVYPLINIATSWRPRPGEADRRKVMWPGSRSTSPGRRAPLPRQTPPPAPRPFQVATTCRQTRVVKPSPESRMSGSTWLTKGSHSSSERRMRASR
jgi:hypothetical protein